jgi:NTP pyrophosphatase (non-canonical NTP hydrolase)
MREEVDTGFLWDFDIYQNEARKTMIKGSLAHLSSGLAAETGEVMGLLQKYHRGDVRYTDGPLGTEFSDEFRRKMIGELGGVLWYLATLADYFDLPLSSVANYNLAALKKRAAEGKIQGDGDFR